MTNQEKRESPAHIARQEKLTEKQAAVEASKARNIAAKHRLTTAEAELEGDKKGRIAAETKLASERARQTVTREQVRDALSVKTDRAVRKICAYHQVQWPKTQGESDRLAQKHERHKRAIGEATGNRNKARAQKARGNPEENDH